MNLSAPDVVAIRSAIAEELAISSKPISYKITGIRRESVWVVLSVGRVGHQHVATIIDEALEGAQAWWAAPGKGGAEVFMVAVEDEEVWLEAIWGPLPIVGELVSFYPPRFLESLLRMWTDGLWVERIRNWLARCPSDNAGAIPAEVPQSFAWLRAAQRTAVQLSPRAAGYIWGPPGTGKTTTIGVRIATYIAAKRNPRVLVLSTTNTAVDEALLAVDRALEVMPLATAEATVLRNRCKRVGHNLDVKRYENRKHLLPPRHPEAVQALIQHQAKRPPESEKTAFATWRAQDDALRQKLRELDLDMIQSAQVVAMTCTRAAYGFDSFRMLPKFDLLVIDEASQVSLAYALAMLPYGCSAIFAGDPEQLAPIVMSSSPQGDTWLARSPFDWRDKLGSKDSIVFLDEQSRMAERICSVVGSVFYGNRLRVCERATATPKWKSERAAARGKGSGFDIVPVTMAGQFSPGWGGPVREESAGHIVELVRDALWHVKEEQIQVLTPFRAQRKMIRAKLKQANVSGIRVSTVHRAQGSERSVIIFDPTDGASKFFDGSTGRRLINVALSRAQAQVYVLLSSADLRNPVLKQIADAAGYRSETLNLPLMCELAHHPEYPHVLDKLVFGYRGAAVRVTGRRGTDSVNLEHVRGREISGRFNLTTMRSACGDHSKCPLHRGPNPPRCVS